MASFQSTLEIQLWSTTTPWINTLHKDTFSGCWCGRGTCVTCLPYSSKQTSLYSQGLKGIERQSKNGIWWHSAPRSPTVVEPFIDATIGFPLPQPIIVNFDHAIKVINSLSNLERPHHWSYPLHLLMRDYKSVGKIRTNQRVLPCARQDTDYSLWSHVQDYWGNSDGMSLFHWRKVT